MKFMNLRCQFLRFGVAVATLAAAYSQSLDNGSNGSDGPLLLTTPGTLVFDPASFTPTLNPSGDRIYHFTSIYVGPDVTIKLSARLLHGPVFWLSQGPVVIDGVIDLDGEDGGNTGAVAGAGGYSGGAPRHPGYSPGNFTPNVFLVPLVGGSGGLGGQANGGGAGGGALLISSSTSITVNGAITANGGSSIDGAGGNGGAIRLVAPAINESNGRLSAKAGQVQGVDGLVRLEAFDNKFHGDLNNTPLAQGKPLGLFLPPERPASIRVVSVGGIPVTTSALTINQSSPVTIVIEARSIPTGTILHLEFVAESGISQSIDTTPLEGTWERSRATASVRFPGGLSRCHVKATWSHEPVRKRPQ